MTFNQRRNNFQKSYSRPRSDSGSRGKAVGGFRRVRSFDPSNFINFPRQIEDQIGEEYVVKNKFSDFNVDETLKKNIAYKGYDIPTPIQDQAIPHLLEGKDLIGIANTGTGKTAAFLIPLINKILKDKSQRVLVITPTRELADQIRKEFFDLSRGLFIYSALCIGGASMGRQRADLSRNPNFVVGTPGRLKDLTENRVINLSSFGSIVLDEADHMVDMGFINDVKFLVSGLQKTRQSLFFSATIDGKVREILRDFVQNPVTVSVKSGDTAQNVEQRIIKVKGEEQKFDQFYELLRDETFKKVLVFARTKHGVQRLSDNLQRKGLRSDAIHGNKRQSQRLRTLENFKRNNIQILIATDVASRGLDIPDVSHVINYDLPETQDIYIHRIGRTARAGKGGLAITFVN